VESMLGTEAHLLRIPRQATPARTCRRRRPRYRWPGMCPLTGTLASFASTDVAVGHAGGARATGRIVDRKSD
jgi:hypothetical protein